MVFNAKLEDVRVPRPQPATALRIAEFDDIEALITQAQTRMVRDLVANEPSSDWCHVTGLGVDGALATIRRPESDTDDHDAPGARGVWLARLNARMASPNLASAWTEFATRCDKQRIAILERRHALGALTVTVPRRPTRELYATLVSVQHRMEHANTAAPTPEEIRALDQCRVNGQLVRTTGDVAAAIAAIEITQLRQLLTLRWMGHTNPLQAPIINTSEPEFEIAAPLASLGAALKSPGATPITRDATPVAQDTMLGSLGDPPTTVLPSAPANTPREAPRLNQAPERPLAIPARAVIAPPPSIAVVATPIALSQPLPVMATTTIAVQQPPATTRNARATANTADASVESPSLAMPGTPAASVTQRRELGMIAATTVSASADAPSASTIALGPDLPSAIRAQPPITVTAAPGVVDGSQALDSMGASPLLISTERSADGDDPHRAHVMPANTPDIPMWVVMANADRGFSLEVDRSNGNTDAIGSVEIIDLATGQTIKSSLSIGDDNIVLLADFAHAGDHLVIVNNAAGTRSDVFTVTIPPSHFVKEAKHARDAKSLLNAFSQAAPPSAPLPSQPTGPEKSNFWVVLDINDGRITLTVDRSFGGTGSIGSVDIFDHATGRWIKNVLIDADGVMELDAAFTHPGLYTFIVRDTTGKQHDAFTTTIAMPLYRGPQSADATPTSVRSVPLLPATPSIAATRSI